MFWTGLASSGARLRRASLKWGVAVVVASGGVAGAPAVARTPDIPGGQALVALATLPPQAQHTHRLILSGGPFPYDKDGTVLGRFHATGVRPNFMTRLKAYGISLPDEIFDQHRSYE